jgi:hypothetical protein
VDQWSAEPISWSSHEDSTEHREVYTE